MLKKFFAVCVLSFTLAACSKPPGNEQVTEAVKKIIPVAFELVKVTELKEVPGLYEVVLRVNQQPIVLYVDKKAQYVFSGSILSISNKANLTMETQKKYLQK